MAQRSSTSSERGDNGVHASHAALLSGVAGYVDAAGFLALFGLLPSHVTADLVSAGAGLNAKPDLPLVAPLCMIPLFMASVAGTALLARALRSRGMPTLAPLFALMTAALSTCCLCGVVFGAFPEGERSWKLVFVAGTAVSAMGIQNAMMRSSLGHLCPTTVMTGNLAQLTIDLVDWFLLRSCTTLAARQQRSAVEGRLARFGLPVLSFLVGTALGGWLTRRFGLLSVGLPVLVLGALTFLAWRETGEPSPAPERRRSRQASGRSSPFARPELASRPEL